VIICTFGLFVTLSLDGDARVALSSLEMASSVARISVDGALDAEALKTVLQRTHLSYNSEAHHDLISALHKSIRGGEANAAVYYTMRMVMMEFCNYHFVGQSVFIVMHLRSKLETRHSMLLVGLFELLAKI
jgi:replication-associated recombination protein RarA